MTSAANEQMSATTSAAIPSAHSTMRRGMARMIRTSTAEPALLGLLGQSDQDLGRRARRRQARPGAAGSRAPIGISVINPLL